MNSPERGNQFELPTESKWDILEDTTSWDDIDWSDPEVFDQPTNASEKVKTPEETQEVHLFKNEVEAYEIEDFDKWEKFLTDRGVKAGEKNDEARDAMYFIFKNLGANNSNARETLIESDSEKIMGIRKDFDEFSKFFETMDDDSKRASKDYIGNVLVSYVNNYDEDFCTEDYRQEIFKRIEIISKREYAGYNDFKEICDGIEVAKMSGDNKYFADYFDYFEELENDPTNEFGNSVYNGRKLCTKSGVFQSYCKNHGMDKDTITGFRESLIPAIDQNDPELSPLYHSSNSWGMRKGDYGISDFMVESMISRINPRNIRDIMQANRLIPTGDYVKYEQNRRDAIALQGTLWAGRDFIHDERPGIHGLFVAMVDMYDAYKSGDHNDYLEKRKALTDIIRDNNEHPDDYLWSGFDGDLALDIDNYDRQIIGEVKAGTDDSEEYDTKAIDILRRLRDNTELSMLERPETGDEELDEIIENIYLRPSETGDTLYADLRETGKLTQKMSDILSEMQGSIGIKPSMVQALSFTERVATYALRNISETDYRELPFDPDFKQIVRFSEITCSPNKFSEIGFENFWSGFITAFSREWSDDTKPDYSRLTMHVLDNIVQLAREYREEGKTDYMTDSLWSGNLVYELLELGGKI